MRAASRESAQQDAAEETKEPAAAAEEEKDNADGDADAAEQQLEDAVKEKREAIDKQ